MTHQGQTGLHEDEISLVDLARILIKRWKLMAAVFGLVVAAGMGYAWISSPAASAPRVAYSTLLSVGFKTPTVFIEPLGAVVTQLEDAFLPAARSELGTDLPVQVSYNQRRNFDEDGSNVIRLVTTLPADAPREPVAALHETALAALLARHERIHESLVSQSAPGAVANEDAAGRLLFPSEVTSLAQATPVKAKDAASSTGLIISLSVVLGGMLALLAVFLAQFIAAVRASFDEDGTDDDPTEPL